MSAIIEPGLMFRLRCLGPAQVTGADDELIKFETRKHVLLLYYLARHPGRPVSRDELIDLFWHGDEDRKARHSLSHAVSLINKALATEAIVASGSSRLVLKDGLLWLDVREFERLVAAGQLVEARLLWSGTLFESYWIRRAPRVEEWLTTERSRIERAFRRLLHDLLEQHRAAGDFEMMRKEGEVLLTLDELDEKAMLAYLEALTLSGDRSLALRRYAEFEKSLSRELDASPSTELRSWAKRQKRGDASLPNVPHNERVHEAHIIPASRPIYGREVEFASLWSHWERTRLGKGSFVILEGQTGIGKTALSIQIANQAYVSGASVCFLKCYGSEQAVPLAPASALIRQLSQQPGFVAMESVWLGELTRLLPALRTRFPAAPLPLPFDDSSRHRLCDAAVEALRATADEQPILLVIDDVLNADEASLALIHYLGRQVPTLGAMLLCTCRSDSPVVGAGARFLETARSGLATTTRLEVLQPDHIARIASQVLAHRAIEATAPIIHAVQVAAGGNPLLALEAAMSVTSEGELPAEPLDSSGLDHFEEISADRLQELPEQVRLVAGAVAVAGRPLSEYEIAVITDLPAAELAVALNLLEQARFVKRSGARVFFSHDRYLEVLPTVIAPSTKRRLHHNVAKYLERTAAGDPSTHYEVAIHYRGAGMNEKAKDQALSAASYADRIGALGSKASALALAAGLPGDPDESLLTDLGFCYLNLHDLVSLRKLCSKKTIGTELTFEFLEAAAGFQEGTSNFRDTARRLERLITNGLRDSWREEAQVLLIRVADKTGDSRLVRATARNLRKSTTNCRSLFGAAYVFLKYYWAHRALPLMQQALEAAQRERCWTIELLARDGIAILLKQVGRYRESIRAFEYSLGLARKTMNPQAEVACLQNRAVSEFCTGDWQQMLATHAEAARVGASFPNWGYALIRQYNESLVWLYQGDAERAEREFEQTLGKCLDANYLALAGQAASGLVLARSRQDNNDGVLKSAALVRQYSDGNTLSWIDAAALAYDLALRTDSVEPGLDLIDVRLRQLRRRDASHYYALLRESIMYRERVTCSRADVQRKLLNDIATESGGGWSLD